MLCERVGAGDEKARDRSPTRMSVPRVWVGPPVMTEGQRPGEVILLDLLPQASTP